MTSTSRLYQTKDLAKVTALSLKQSFMHSTFTLKMSESTADDAHECSVWSASDTNVGSLPAHLLNISAVGGRWR